MKLPLFFHIIIFWLVGIVVNLIFKSLFGFINFNQSYGFLMLLVYSLDYTLVFILRKKFSFSLLSSVILFISLISVFIFMIFIWSRTGRESVLGQFILLFANLLVFSIYLTHFWDKFNFEYLSHILVVFLYAVSSTIIYILLFKFISGKASSLPSLKLIFLKQLAFIVPYPFVYKISAEIMNFLEINFTTPTQRIIIEDKKETTKPTEDD